MSSIAGLPAGARLISGGEAIIARAGKRVFCLSEEGISAAV
jgi:hypothetical protein